ncbi:alkyl sulfatase [Listeria monocytogenes]|nr:alkyl sulfatase [Listeria monocytogenes]
MFDNFRNPAIFTRFIGYTRFFHYFINATHELDVFFRHIFWR